MTEDLTQDMNLLAADADPVPIDTYDVITKAKARTRNRRTALASVLGALVVAGAMAGTIGLVGGTPDDSGAVVGVGAEPSDRPTTVRDRGACLDGTGASSCTKVDTADDESRKLTEQLAGARARLLPTGSTVEPRPSGISESFEFRAAFGEYFYAAYASLTDAEGRVDLAFEVGLTPTDATLANYVPLDMVLLPCTVGVSDCTERTLPDGTVARAKTQNPPSTVEPITYVTALRPDGTYIQVSVSLDTRPSAPFTLDEMFEFATAFTY